MRIIASKTVDHDEIVADISPDQISWTHHIGPDQRDIWEVNIGWATLKGTQDELLTFFRTGVHHLDHQRPLLHYPPGVRNIPKAGPPHYPADVVTPAELDQAMAPRCAFCKIKLAWPASPAVPATTRC